MTRKAMAESDPYAIQFACAAQSFLKPQQDIVLNCENGVVDLRKIATLHVRSRYQAYFQFGCFSMFDFLALVALVELGALVALVALAASKADNPR